jgi:uncharacterized protein (TIGR00725 family)
MRAIIAVIGGQSSASDEAKKLAREVGRLIAERDAYLMCGGLEGVMEAACRGAKEAGGTTIGVLPSGSKSDANRFVDIPIATGMGTARNVIIIRTADAIIAIDGSYGTLSEIAHALDQGKNVISLHSWPLQRIGVDKGLLIEASTPAQAVELAFECVGKTA